MNDDYLYTEMNNLFHQLRTGEAVKVNGNGGGVVPLCCSNDKCQSSLIFLVESNHVCEDCGTIVERFIDDQAEWRSYGLNDTKSVNMNRCGMATTSMYPEYSLGSLISYDVNARFSAQVRNMIKYQRWNSVSYKERTLYNVSDDIFVKASMSGIPSSIIEEAKNLYKKVSEKCANRGEIRAGIIASCVFWSCKNNHVPRSCKETADMFNISTSVFAKGCKKFQEIMNLKMKSATPVDFVPRFCSNLNLSKEHVDSCISVLKIIEEYNIISESTPPSITAGVIYLIVNHYKLSGITKKNISVACNISEITINKCYKKLLEYQEYLFEET
jgi:transcription initiation factor TFIIB